MGILCVHACVHMCVVCVVCVGEVCGEWLGALRPGLWSLGRTRPSDQKSTQHMPGGRFLSLLCGQDATCMCHPAGLGEVE